MDYREQLHKQWWQVKVADQALQVEKDRRRQLFNERLIKKTQDGTLSCPTDEPGIDDALRDDPMGIKIGDTYMLPTPAPRAIAIPIPPPVSGLTIADRLFPWLIAGAIGAGAMWYFGDYGKLEAPGADFETEIHLEK